MTSSEAVYIVLAASVHPLRHGTRLCEQQSNKRSPSESSWSSTSDIASNTSWSSSKSRMLKRCVSFLFGGFSKNWTLLKAGFPIAIAHVLILGRLWKHFTSLARLFLHGPLCLPSVRYTTSMFGVQLPRGSPHSSMSNVWQAHLVASVVWVNLPSNASRCIHNEQYISNVVFTRAGLATSPLMDDLDSLIHTEGLHRNSWIQKVQLLSIDLYEFIFFLQWPLEQVDIQVWSKMKCDHHQASKGMYTMCTFPCLLGDACLVMIINSKRAALEPENASMLCFLAENLS